MCSGAAGGNMARPHKRPEKAQNGSLKINLTLPPEMADAALSLYDDGYSPEEWAKEGIRSLKNRVNVVIA